MTITSSAALRMPYSASVAASAPRALGVSAEPRAPKLAMVPSHRTHGLGLGGTIVPAFTGRQGGTEGSDRFGGITRSSIGTGWDRQDWAQNAGGGPLRG